MNTGKNRSRTWDYFEEVDVEEQTGSKGEPLILDTNGNKTFYIQLEMLLTIY